MVHNTPFGDIVDTEDDLQPLVWRAFTDARRGMALTAASMAGAEFDVRRMRERAAQGWVTVTELADTLARDHGLAFSTAHQVASGVIRGVREAPGSSIEELVASETAAAGREVRLTNAELSRILSPEYFVEIRRTHGGPSFDVVRQAIDGARQEVEHDSSTVSAARAAIEAARARLEETIDRL